jgi:hypothetical protein
MALSPASHKCSWSPKRYSLRNRVGCAGSRTITPSNAQSVRSMGLRLGGWLRSRSEPAPSEGVSVVPNTRRRYNRTFGDLFDTGNHFSYLGAGRVDQFQNAVQGGGPVIRGRSMIGQPISLPSMTKTSQTPDRSKTSSRGEQAHSHRLHHAGHGYRRSFVDRRQMRRCRRTRPAVPPAGRSNPRAGPARHRRRRSLV